MIELVKNIDIDVWNSFVIKEQPNQLITIGHNPSLGDILEKTFGYQSENYLIKKDKEIIGVLPTVKFRGKIISLPHFSYGGPLFKLENKVTPDFINVFGKNKFELRGFEKFTPHTNEKKIIAIIKLEESAQAQMMELKSSFRRKIRLAKKLNFKTKRGALNLLEDFYDVYSRKMLQKGSPTLGKRFFKNILEGYKYGEAVITALYENDKVIAAGITLSYLGFNELCWVSTNRLYDKHNVNSLLYWTIIEDSIEKGYHCFSLGRSTRNSNNHLYKKRWKPIELPIYFSFSEPQKVDVKEFTFLTNIWKYQPLISSQIVGGYVSKYIY